jgi:NAD(P)H-dependent flavin oxidoreductase YrpB (nitropropane dioxygenase family)
MFVNKAKGKVNGFIIEGPTAGGHNAPPRGKPIFNEFDEPVYGERDVVDLERIREFGLPFWLAGGYASPSKIEDAISKGAAGVQLGSIFALSSGSGMRPDLKRELIRQAYAGEMVARTDALASPSGFPFKVDQLTQTLSNPENYKKRCRICDITRLRHPAQKPDGSIVYRCPSEPVASYIGKGGKEQDTHGRKCLCNALLSDIGLHQHQMNGYDEQPLITIGDNVDFVRDLISSPEGSYTVADAIKYLTRVAVPVG